MADKKIKLTKKVISHKKSNKLHVKSFKDLTKSSRILDDDKIEEDADLDESDGYTGKAGKGGTGYDGKAGKGGTGYDAGSKALQERFQKLANIIK